MKWIPQNILKRWRVGRIYEVPRRSGLRWHDMHTKFHEGWSRPSGNIKIITSKIWEAAMFVLVTRRV
jgi:hypothetical protein